MICLACEKKMREIKKDSEGDFWHLKFHKKCWKKRNIYFELYLKTLKIEGHSEKVLEFYRKRSCFM